MRRRVALDRDTRHAVRAANIAVAVAAGADAEEHPTVVALVKVVHADRRHAAGALDAQPGGAVVTDAVADDGRRGVEHVDGVRLTSEEDIAFDRRRGADAHGDAGPAVSEHGGAVDVPRRFAGEEHTAVAVAEDERPADRGRGAVGFDAPVHVVVQHAALDLRPCLRRDGDAVLRALGDFAVDDRRSGQDAVDRDPRGLHAADAVLQVLAGAVLADRDAVVAVEHEAVLHLGRAALDARDGRAVDVVDDAADDARRRVEVDLDAVGDAVVDVQAVERRRRVVPGDNHLRQLVARHDATRRTAARALLEQQPVRLVALDPAALDHRCRPVAQQERDLVVADAALEDDARALPLGHDGVPAVVAFVLRVHLRTRLGAPLAALLAQLFARLVAEGEPEGVLGRALVVTVRVARHVFEVRDDLVLVGQVLRQLVLQRRLGQQRPLVRGGGAASR
mmetsp:Transcript_51637/g.159133  ORF Transcript_51637/g.159133 Transcript_51637/m.159133 type:complete len:450 (-) Transcript_51637:846-2195(-)